MAGAGKKTFTAGETLTASDVNSYLMEQSVMVFGGTAARSSAIPTPTEGMTTYIGTTGTATIPQIETYTGSAWQTPYGMTLVGNANFTAASSVVFNNVFTSAFDNYVIKMKHTSTNQGSVVSLRLRVGGTDDTSANYRYWGYNVMTATGVASYGNNATSVFVGSVTSTSPVYAQHEIASPALAESTTGSTLVSRLDGSNRMDFYGLGNIHTVSTAYDGFNMIAPGGQTITGSIKVYGLRNS